MSKPFIHSISSAKKFGGKPEDYADLHNMLDSSKSVIGDNRHRALTHNAWFVFIMEKIFGETRVNSDGRRYSVREICEQHILEDFGGKFIPTAQDYLQEIEFKPWMGNGKGEPPKSVRKELSNEEVKIDKENPVRYKKTGVVHPVSANMLTDKDFDFGDEDEEIDDTIIDGATEKENPLISSPQKELDEAVEKAVRLFSELNNNYPEGKEYIPPSSKKLVNRPINKKVIRFD